MTYVKTGPFVAGSAPGITATFLNNVENFLVLVNSAATDANITADGSGNASVVSLKVTGGKIGYTTVGDVLDASGYDTFLKARGSSNLVHLQQNNTDVVTFGSSGMLLPSGLIGRTSNGDLIDASGNGVYIKGKSGSGLLYQSPNGTTLWTRTQETHGSVSVGAGVTATVNHNLSGTPDMICVTPVNSATGSQTWSTLNWTSTTFQIFSAANTVTYYWLAIRF